MAAFAAAPGLAGPELTVAVAVAQWAVLLGPAVLLGLWFAGSAADRAAAVATGTAAVLALAIAAALSPIVDAPRPFMDGQAVNYLGHARDGSFPSDHATLAFALAIGLWLRRPSQLPRIWITLLVLAAGVGCARVFLGAHYPSDIAGGALVGAAAVTATATSPGRAVTRVLTAVCEAVRDRTLAGWRRVAGGPRSPGASDR